MTALRRYFPAFLVLTAAVLGCSSDPPTLRTAKPVEVENADAGFELKPPAKPKSSDPDAKKKLDAMIAAHTGGKPELLAKLKNATFVRNGIINSNGPRTAAQTIDLEWPTRYKYKTEITVDAQIVFQAGLTPTENWLYPAEPDPTKPLPDKPQ